MYNDKFVHEVKTREMRFKKEWIVATTVSFDADSSPKKPRKKRDRSKKKIVNLEDIQIWEYAPMIFHDLRLQDGIKQIDIFKLTSIILC
jgi:hypothetical protein